MIGINLNYQQVTDNSKQTKEKQSGPLQLKILAYEGYTAHCQTLSRRSKPFIAGENPLWMLPNRISRKGWLDYSNNLCYNSVYKIVFDGLDCT